MLRCIAASVEFDHLVAAGEAVGVAIAVGVVFAVRSGSFELILVPPFINEANTAEAYPTGSSSMQVKYCY